ncbi:MAG: hypothetical protein ABII01_03520 [Candidatus Woesearchaeota archaeon]
MKIKKIKIQIKSLDRFYSDAAEVMEKVKNREYVKPKEIVSFEDYGVFKRFFSDKRIELLRLIKYKKPKSIYQLAKLAKRNYKNVYDDVKLFEMMGLITSKKMEFEYDKLQVDLIV